LAGHQATDKIHFNAHKTALLLNTCMGEIEWV